MANVIRIADLVHTWNTTPDDDPIKTELMESYLYVNLTDDADQLLSLDDSATEAIFAAYFLEASRPLKFFGFHFYPDPFHPYITFRNLHRGITQSAPNVDTFDHADDILRVAREIEDKVAEEVSSVHPDSRIAWEIAWHQSDSWAYRFWVKYVEEIRSDDGLDEFFNALDTCLGLLRLYYRMYPELLEVTED